MSVEERRRLEMLERLGEVLGADVADTVLAHLPPQGEQVATAAQVESHGAATTAQIEALRTDTTAQIEALRTDTTAQIEALRTETAGQIDALRTEMQHLFALQGERLAARWRRDLLLLAVPQFLVLLGIVVSLNI